MTRRFLKNGTSTSSKGGDSSMTSGTSVETVWSEIPDTAEVSASRPTMTTHQSSSLPSTPYQRPRTLSYDTRPSSPGRAGGHVSPRSSHSDSNQSLPALRKLAGGCKYETGMAQARRRVPYSMGPDKLGPEQFALKESLTDIEDAKLSGDMRELFDRLQPSRESEERRKKLVEKLEKILNERWPGHSIKVNVFGSTGNKLGTTDSDVDICITTDLKELEHVCSLAELLASHGMERVVCVSSAKVPIVKIWDPELRLACDMNVNNPIALENTEMILTYVGIDPRVRPLAMIIKYWAKRRILNEPALGSTLSSYTWICMIINFLQTRSPPILPSLQQQPNLKRKIMNGIDVTFDKDVNLYSRYGARNKDSLGQLLFQFFRYYAHELDFEKKVISVRLGKVISKVEKGWSFLQDNRLCVEEPFNISRNLGNTADDTSMRGIHLELRRAFRTTAEANLDKCCEQYEYPVDENKPSEIFVLPEPRPIVAQMPPSQPASRGRGNGRGGKHTNNRGSHNVNRRTFNSGTRVHPSLHHFGYQMTPQELQLHAQQQQFLLHDQLYQQYQYLQAQEQELRQQLRQQAFLQGRATTSMPYPHIPFPSYASSDIGREEASGGRVNTLDDPPLSAPLVQHRFPYASPYLSMTIPRLQNPITNPSSPRLHSTVPDRQRVSRHASLTDPFPTSSLRAQSQPARPIPSPLAFQTVMTEEAEEGDSIGNGLSQSRRQSTASSLRDPSSGYLSSPRASLPHHFGSERRSSEYIGYYVGHSPPLQARPRSSQASPVPSYTGLAIQNGGLSPRLFAQLPSYQSTIVTPLERVQSPSGEAVSNENEFMGSFQISAARQTPPQLKAKRSSRLVVNGSATYNDKQVDATIDGPEQSTGTNFSASTSEDLAFDTPTSSEDQSQGLPETIDSELPLLSAHSHTGQVEDGLQHGMMNPVNGRFGLTDGKVDRGSGTVQMPAKSSSKAAKVKMDQKSLPNGFGGQPLHTQVSMQLSPVRETPVSLPNGDVCESPKDASNRSPKTKGKGRQDKAPLAGGENQRRKDITPPSTVNGITPNPPERNNPNGVVINNGWQTQKKKKHRKASKSESDINPLNTIASDFLPNEENLRKGG